LSTSSLPTMSRKMIAPSRDITANLQSATRAFAPPQPSVATRLRIPMQSRLAKWPSGGRRNARHLPTSSDQHQVRQSAHRSCDQPRSPLARSTPSARKPAIYSHRFTAGSPKGSIHLSYKMPKCCSTSYADCARL
jgi:hypothetical protein